MTDLHDLWKRERSHIIAPEPYDHDAFLVIGDIEARIHVRRTGCWWDVYPEPQRPPGADGTRYGRSLCASGFVDAHELTGTARDEALAKAQTRCERAVQMLREGMTPEVVWVETGSKAFWDEIQAAGNFESARVARLARERCDGNA